MFGAVVVPGLLRSWPTEARTTWLEILRDICNFPSTVDLQLLVAGSVQLDVLEHAHENDPVQKIFRRGIPLRKNDDELDRLKRDTTNCRAPLIRRFS